MEAKSRVEKGDRPCINSLALVSLKQMRTREVGREKCGSRVLICNLSLKQMSCALLKLNFSTFKSGNYGAIRHFVECLLILDRTQMIIISEWHFSTYSPWDSLSRPKLWWVHWGSLHSSWRCHRPLERGWNRGKNRVRGERVTDTWKREIHYFFFSYHCALSVG